MKTIRPALGGLAAALLLFTLLLGGCGDDASGDPVGIDTRDLPTEGVYVTARVEVLDAFTAGQAYQGFSSTTLPRDCDGDPIPGGTTWFLEADTAGGGLQFGTPIPNIPCHEPLGNPTFLQMAVAGTDQSGGRGVFLRLPSISFVEALLSEPLPVAFPGSTLAAGFDMDISCQDQRGLSFQTEDRTCVPPNAEPPNHDNCNDNHPDPTQTFDDEPCCEYSTRWENGVLIEDEVFLDEFTLVQNSCGEWVFEPGTTIKGRANYTVETAFQSGGALRRARVFVETCFSFPTSSPPGSFVPELGASTPCF